MSLKDPTLLNDLEVVFKSYQDQQRYDVVVDWVIASLKSVWLGSDSKADVCLPLPGILPKWVSLKLNQDEGVIEFEVNQGSYVLSQDGQHLQEGAFYLPQTLLFPDIGELKFSVRKKNEESTSSKKISGLIKDRYQVLKVLGEGGFSHVALAKDEVSGGLVAIKVIHHKVSEDRDLMEKIMDRFFQEMKLLISLSHPNVMKILDYGFDQVTWSPFYVMEYVDGKSLIQFVSQFAGEERWGVASGLLKQFLEGLGYLHDRGIVHRDLKPENVLVSGVYPDLQLKILDLGLAKMLQTKSYDYQATDTKERESFGTPPYMSPEQCLNAKQVTPASDVYAVGILTCILFSNQYPYQIDQSKSYEQIHVSEGHILKKISHLMPPAILKLIDASLEKNPEKRLKNAREMKSFWEKNETHIYFELLGCRMEMLRREWSVYFLFVVMFLGGMALLWVFTYKWFISKGWVQ